MKEKFVFLILLQLQIYKLYAALLFVFRRISKINVKVDW